MKQTNQYLRIILFSFLLIVAICEPTPQCRTGNYYQTLPLIGNYTTILHLDSIFSGYNLNFSLYGSYPYNNIIELKQKLQVLQYYYPDALTYRGNRTLVHHGSLSVNTSAPVINNYWQVYNLPNTTCFDAVVHPQAELIIVDCIYRRSTRNLKGQMLENVFYYFKFPNGEPLGKLNTEMYVSFEQIVRRRMEIYSDLYKQHTFLLRTYYAEGIEYTNKDNTYVEVFMISEPTKPWIVAVLDRTFLYLPRLRISDVKIYLGEIYVLDYLKGVYRVSISVTEELVVNGFYEGRGFTRMAVFSSDLENKFELALAGNDIVYEIDWSDRQNPYLLTKYSLMPSSRVSQIFLNDRFLFVQSSTPTNQTIYNYTWTFNRGDRIYNRAFQVIKHTTAETMIDLNEQMSYLLVLDGYRLVNYAFDQGNLIINMQYDEDLLDRMLNFTIVARSSDPLKQGELQCRMVVNFTLLEDNNRTMWPIGIKPPSLYNANYPGRIRIQLSEYVLAPNVTYQLRETKHGYLNFTKVFQSDQLKLTWTGNPPPFYYMGFLQTYTFNDEVQDTLVIYMQDANNLTYISYCQPDHEEISVKCEKTSVYDIGGKLKNWATTSFSSQLEYKTYHIAVYTTSKHYNSIYLTDLTVGKAITELQLGKGFIGNVTSVGVTGRYLYVVLHYIKTVQVYDLEKCIQETCEPICAIDHLKMYALGLRYFSPLAVHSSVYHPSAIFIKTADSIIALDVSKECSPRLLTVIRPVPDSLTEFIFEVNANYLVVTTAPNIIQYYDLSRLYLKYVLLTKKYPMYGYKLPRNYDFDISDYSNCVYFSVVSYGGDYNIFVYRSGYPAIGSLYTVLDLYVFQNVLLDASGFKIDYITVLSGKEMRIFREYEKPVAEIENPKQDYQFLLEYYNTVQSGQLETISVKIVNLPTYIEVNPKLKDIMLTKDLLFSGVGRLSEINDSDWYAGNVLRIKSDCWDCEKNIQVNNHIAFEETYKVAPLLMDFQWTATGGTLQSKVAMFRLKNNGTISQTILYPNMSYTICQNVAAASSGQLFEVSGCLTDKYIVLYVTSYIGDKAFTFYPYQSKAKSMLTLRSYGYLVMLVYAGEIYSKHTGGVFLYALASDPDTDSSLQYVDYITMDDLSSIDSEYLYISNAELNYIYGMDLYRLYIVEFTRGVFVVDFGYVSGQANVNVKYIGKIDVNGLLDAANQTMPYDSFYRTIKLINTTTIMNGSTLLKTLDTVLLVTTRYHTIQLYLTYDNNNKLIDSKIIRLYLRYAYYEVGMLIRYHNELFVIGQELPERYDIGNQSKQLLTVYSTRGYFNGTIEMRGLIGAYTIMDHVQVSFDLNLTYNYSDQHSEPRVGLVVLQGYKDGVDRLSLHRNLSVFTTEEVDTQIIYIDLINDFSLEKIRILMNGRSPFPEWKIIVIVLFSFIGLLLLVAGLVVGGKKIKEYREATRESLMTEESVPY